MKSLTAKESEMMVHFWKNGAMFIKDLRECYPDPKPHINTLSTVAHILEEKGYLGHKSYGNSHQYFPTVAKEEYRKKTLKGMIVDYFDNSYLNAVSAMVKDEELTVDDLKQLIDMIEKGAK